MTGDSVLVLGATGKTGRLVASLLRQRGDRVRAVSRSSATRFDWDDERTWAPALAGIGSVYLATPTVPDLAVDAVRAFVPRAVRSGVRRLVLLSGRSARAGSKRMLALEEPVRSSGVAWTILRPSVFNQNFAEGRLRDAVRAGTLRQIATGHAPIDFIDVADIAEVAVAALTADGHGGQTYELSGPRALSYADAMAVIADETGRAIEVVEVDPAEWAAGALAAGTSQDAVAWSLEAATGVRDCFYATPFDDVRRVLGRAPRAFEDFVREAADIWR
ncbi:NAD(P)H-binding protein [Amycolatopsis taiwanensis]|uniref:NmrA family transcriptional regulator n=1 Tax=Amycolatopsis taiwanensis TaxID=342230 RepID=A0A9W6VH01_9PSEU|nr:NAD(P)H-binding protein [Amycolatopsis taiwanensis]GLY68255.1 NmrA family transcriptional regulator [Amycolatopsis taiwanensis]